MNPVISIVGRPNVGKSTLFNCLTKSQDALVADIPGLTRDRIYGEGRVGGKPFIVIDTGGLGSDERGMEALMMEQSQQAIAESDLVLFLVDGRSGLSATDELIAKQLRTTNKSIKLVVNKVDGLNSDIACAEFFSLGLGEPHPISAAHAQGITALVTDLMLELADNEEIATDQQEIEPGIKLAIVGRPNVGKSTLVNRMLGEERVIVCDMPGTTRDSIFIPFQRRDKYYTLIDTAGVRKRSKITDKVEKFSIIKTLQAIENAQVVLLVLDARSGISEQDLHLLGFIIDAGKAIVIAVNKWDNLELDIRSRVKSELDRRLNFIDFARIHLISALHGTGVGEIFASVEEAYHSATKKLSTSVLNEILVKAVAQHQPPLVHGRQVKLRYAHVGGYNPPQIIIHGNQTQELPNSYRRYLAGVYRKSLRLIGTPIHIELKNSENPYAAKKNILTRRQVRKRKRLYR